MAWSRQLDVGWKVAGVQADNHFILETILTGVKEVTELPLEIME